MLGRFAYLDLASTSASPRAKTPNPPSMMDAIEHRHIPAYNSSSSPLRLPHLDLALLMDATPVSFPSLLPRDYTASPLSPTSPLSVLSSSDEDESPPQTPDTAHDPLPPPLHLFDSKSYYYPEHDEYLLSTPAITTAPLSDELFDYSPHPASFAASFARLCMQEAYLYPGVASTTTTPLCVYDPTWHIDANPHLPRVCVHGCPDALPMHEEEQCWDHLVVPQKMHTGRMSEDDEEYYFSARDEEEGEELEELDAFGRRRWIGPNGALTYVPPRVEGRRWLWKNF